MHDLLLTAGQLSDRMKYHYTQTDEGKRAFKDGKKRLGTAEPQTKLGMHFNRPDVHLDKSINKNVTSAFNGRKLTKNP
jgi:hypothetical protein